MRSQKRVELNLWEMKTVVLSLENELYFKYNSFSAIGSNAAVGSSKIKIGAFL